MQEFLNCYEILGIKNTATLREIKDAYREKCKENHPDKVGNTKEAHENMCKINEAYETLTDTSRRTEHDYQLRQKIRREKSKQWDAEQKAKQQQQSKTAEPQKEEPKKEAPSKPIFEWTEPVFKNRKAPDRSDFSEDYLYCHAVNEVYVEEDDYNQEESEEYINFLDLYIQTYMEKLQHVLYMKIIEEMLYNKIEEQFDIIYQYTVYYYEKESKPTILTR